MRTIIQVKDEYFSAIIPTKKYITFHRDNKDKETGCLTNCKQAYRRSVLYQIGVFINTYYYKNETEAVQAGAVFEMHNYMCTKEKSASGRRRNLDFVHPTLGKLFAATIFDY